MISSVFFFLYNVHVDSICLKKKTQPISAYILECHKTARPTKSKSDNAQPYAFISIPAWRRRPIKPPEKRTWRIYRSISVVFAINSGTGSFMYVRGGHGVSVVLDIHNRRENIRSETLYISYNTQFVIHPPEIWTNIGVKRQLLRTIGLDVRFIVSNSFEV